MPKIQNRIIDTFEELKKDFAVTNWAICKNQQDEETVIAIYEQFAKRRHDLQIYRVESEEEECILCLLIKRSKLDEEKYFKKIRQYKIVSGVTKKDVMNDENVLNYVITENIEIFNEATKILKRSIKYTLHPSRTEVFQLLLKDFPELYVAVLIQDGVNNAIIEEENFSM